MANIASEPAARRAAWSASFPGRASAAAVFTTARSSAVATTPAWKSDTSKSCPMARCAVADYTAVWNRSPAAWLSPGAAAQAAYRGQGASPVGDCRHRPGQHPQRRLGRIALPPATTAIEADCPKGGRPHRHGRRRRCASAGTRLRGAGGRTGRSHAPFDRQRDVRIGPEETAPLVRRFV